MSNQDEKDPQVVGRIYSDNYGVRVVLNSEGRKLPDGTPLFADSGRTCRWRLDEYLIKTQCNRTLHWASTVGAGAGGKCDCGGKIVEDE